MSPHPALWLAEAWPAHDEALVCQGPVQQEGVHGRERDGEGGQEIRQGKVYNQDFSVKKESDARRITRIGY